MGLENFILTCEKDNESLRKDIDYYKNYNKRLKKEKQELIEYLKKEQDRLTRECSSIYEDGLGKTILVN